MYQLLTEKNSLINDLKNHNGAVFLCRDVFVSRIGFAGTAAESITLNTTKNTEYELTYELGGTNKDSFELASNTLTASEAVTDNATLTVTVTKDTKKATKVFNLTAEDDGEIKVNISEIAE